MKDYLRERAQTLKMRCLHAYGGRCACCGIDHTEFLCIDHIDGGGNKQRKELGGGSSRLHPWLVKNNFPPGYQILCFNCNAGKERGLCPRTRCLTFDRL